MNENKENSKKKKYRKSLIFLTLILLLFFIFWFFLLDLIVEKYIEKAGTKAVGAKVELGSVDVSVLPVGIDMFKLQVTNPDAPMENSVAIDHIQAAMEITPLFKSKLIVNNMLFDKIQFNTPRKKSGAIAGQQSALKNNEQEKSALLQQLCQQNDLNLFDSPDVKDILKNEYKSLESVKLAEDIKKNISSAQENYKKKLETLLDDKKIEEYKVRIEKIRKKDSSNFALLGSVLEFREIYKELEDDLDDIKDVKKEFKAELNGFKNDLKKLSTVQARDIARLKKKYAFMAGDKLELTKLLFGPGLCAQLEKYSKWFALAEPYLKSSDKQADSGEPNKTEAKEPGNNFFLLIQNMQANILFKNGMVSGKASNITNMPALSKLPTIIDFSGGGFEGLGSMDLKGILNSVNPDHPVHEIKFDMSGLQLENFIFSDKPDLSVAIVNAATSLVSNFKMDGSQLSGSAKAQFDKVIMQADSLKGSSIQKALVKTLSDVNQFNLTLDMAGTLEDYKIAIKSDLDKFFSKSIQKMAQSKMGNFENELKANILQKTAGPVKETNNSFTDFSGIDGQLSEKSAQSQALLNDIN